MKKLLKILLKLVTILFLTLLTQIGGLVFLINEGLFFKKKVKLLQKIASYLAVYSFLTFMIIPFIAPIFGREKVKHSNTIKPTNYLTVFLNRNYVKPELNTLLHLVENELKGTTITINYLDANFPFIDNFPLLPHLSHNDGKKLDLSLVYETKSGKISSSQKSISGYGIFEAPKPHEYNQIKNCKDKGYFQYDFQKYISFGEINSHLVFSKKGTKRLITTILKQKILGKLFIESHLKSRLNLKHNKVRFHGCKAVRHDDHIHIQL